MKNNKEVLQQWAELDIDTVDFNELEKSLEHELAEHFDELSALDNERKKIGNPNTLGETVMNVVWEQFLNQIAVTAGEDFIRENRGLLDLSDDAHIQTTDNFIQGKFPSHNNKIDYQKRYYDWKSNFQYDEKGDIKTHQTRSGRNVEILVKGARKPFDKERPIGSVERGTDIDHVIPAAEFIRDPATNAHLTKEEQIAFANSEVNLNEMDASQNRSKGDNSMTDWLDYPNKNGQKPNEVFDISEEQNRKYREKDAEARAEYEKLKAEGEQRSKEIGRESQKDEFFRVSGKALKAVVMSMLASLVKDIIRKLIKWFRSGKRVLSTFIDSIEDAIKEFIKNMKRHLKNAGDTLLTTIATAIIGPIVGVIKKAWIFLKQGYNSVKEAIEFLTDPQNAKMPFSMKLLKVGKIIIAGLTAGGAILLGEVIADSLKSIGINVVIPLFGSLADLLGIFFGAVISGIIGALALDFIDRMVAKKLQKENAIKTFDTRNTILATQTLAIQVATVNTVEVKNTTAMSIIDRHCEAGEIARKIINETDRTSTDTDNTNDRIRKLLNKK